MREISVFSPHFEQRLRRDGYFVDDLMEEAVPGRARKAVRRWTDGRYSRGEIEDGFWNPGRDSKLPPIKDQLGEMLGPWIRTGAVEILPTFTLKELGRAVSMYPGRIYNVLQQQSPEFPIGEDIFATIVTSSELNGSMNGNGKRNFLTGVARDRAYEGVHVSFVRK